MDQNQSHSQSDSQSHSQSPSYCERFKCQPPVGTKLHDDGSFSEVRGCWKCHLTPDTLFDSGRIGLVISLVHGCPSAPEPEPVTESPSPSPSPDQRMRDFWSSLTVARRLAVAEYLRDCPQSEYDDLTGQMEFIERKDNGRIERQFDAPTIPGIKTLIDLAIRDTTVRIKRYRTPPPPKPPDERRRGGGDREIVYPPGLFDMIDAPPSCKVDSISKFDLRVLTELFAKGPAKRHTDLLARVDDAVFEYFELISGKPIDFMAWRRCWRGLLNNDLVTEHKRGWDLTDLGTEAVLMMRDEPGTGTGQHLDRDTTALALRILSRSRNSLKQANRNGPPEDHRTGREVSTHKALDHLERNTVSNACQTETETETEVGYAPPGLPENGILFDTHEYQYQRSHPTPP